MKRTILALLVLCLSMQLFGQIEKARDLLDQSGVGLKRSWESANLAIEEIQKCHLSTSIADLQFNAKKAMAAVEKAMLLAKEAESVTDGAVGECGNLNCKVAEKEAEKLKGILKKAKNNFDDAFTTLGFALDEEGGGAIIDYLNTALSSIEKGMNQLKKGAEELENTKSKLPGCR